MPRRFPSVVLLSLCLLSACNEGATSPLTRKYDPWPVGAKSSSDEWSNMATMSWVYEPMATTTGGYPNIQVALQCNYRIDPQAFDLPSLEILIQSLRGDLPSGEFKLKGDHLPLALQTYEDRPLAIIRVPSDKFGDVQVRFDKAPEHVHVIDLTSEGPAQVVAHCAKSIEDNPVP